MHQTIQTGTEGEDQAVDYLKAQGFTILERNYRFKHGEIDIIAKEKERLVFIEVKYRKNNFYGYPESFVSKKQMNTIRSTAEFYLFKKNWLKNIRFDIIAITGEEKPQHFKDAF